MSSRTRASATAIINNIRKRSRHHRLSVLLLEDRVVPATITVTNTLDDTATGNGVSLREAIASLDGGANLNTDVVAVGAYSVNDTILFNSTFNGPHTINMSGEFVVSTPMTITGPGSNKLTINSTAVQSTTSRVFNITAPSSISGVRLTGGNVIDSGGVGGAGGGIALNQDTTLTDTIVSGNTAKFQGGGIAVYSYAPLSITLTMVRSTVSGNNSSNVGGGVYLGYQANLDLVDSTISNNSASSSGGGVYSFGGFFSNGNNLSMTGSTISGNHSGVRGGGVYLYDATATIVDSTISGNFALAGGGLMGLSYYAATVLVQNSTVAFNTASGAGGGLVSNLGNGSLPIDLQIDSTIVGKNISQLTPTPAGPDIFGHVTANFSLIGNTTDATIDSGANNKLNVDPLLGPLAFNGGLTMTHALTAGSGSLAIGAGEANSLPTDQRGNARTVGGLTDIGAYEIQSPAKFSSVVINNGDIQRSMVRQVKVTFNQHIGFSGAAAAAFSLNRINQIPAPPDSVTLAAAVDDTGSGTAVTLTFTGGAVDGASLADGRYALHILASGFNAEGFDGNNNGVAQGSPADNFAFDEPSKPVDPLNPMPGEGPLDAAKIFRIFGDANGDGAVASNDFALFRLSFNGVNDVFDFDGDGFVSTSDFGQFKNRFNSTI
jgi:hypothetical protein